MVIFCAAISIRLIYLAQDHSSPFFDHRGIDAVEYDQMAHAMWNATWPGQEPLGRPPLYPLNLAILYTLIGDSPGVVKIYQSVLGSISCVLVFLIARRLFSDRAVAWLSAGICCAYGTLIYFDAQLLPANLETFLQLGLVLALLRAGERAGSALAWLPAGILVALSVLNRGGTLIVLPLLLFWLVLSRRSAGGDSSANDARRIEITQGGGLRPSRAPGLILSAAALCAPTALAITLTATHNAAHDASHAGRVTGNAGSTIGNLMAGRFCLVASNSGINFLLGNDPALQALNDTNHPDHFILYDHLLSDARRAAPQSISAQDRYFVRTALDRIASEPVAFAGLLARKAMLLINGVEIARNSNPYAHRRYSPLLALLLWRHGIAFPNGLIIPLAAVGLASVWRDWRRFFPLLVVLGAQALFIFAFFVTDRYRVPMLPIVAILAASGAWKLWRRWRARSIESGVLGAFALLAAGVFVCNLDVAPYYDHHGAYEFKYLADDRERRGNLDAAVEFAREAVRLQGDSAPARHQLGVLLRKKAVATSDDRAALEAIEQFQEAARLRPDFDAAFGDLGLTDLVIGRLHEAESAMTRAVKLAPDVPVWRLDLGAIYTKQGRYDDAIDCHRAALKIDPQFAPAYASIGAIREYQGRLDEAIDAYRTALRYDPENADTRSKLGRARSARSGSPAASVSSPDPKR